MRALRVLSMAVSAPRRSGMGGLFVVSVAGGLELDGGVLDVEMPGQALLQLVQQLGQVPIV